MKQTLILSILATFAVNSAAFADPVTLVLKLKERTSMAELARSVSDPSSARFNKFYTTEEIRALAAPTDAEYQSLIDSLKQRNFTIVRESKSHLIVTVSAEQANVESTLGTRLKREALGLTGPVSLVKIPNDLDLVESVTGLDQTAKMHPLYNMADLTASKTESRKPKKPDPVDSDPTSTTHKPRKPTDPTDPKPDPTSEGHKPRKPKPTEPVNPDPVTTAPDPTSGGHKPRKPKPTEPTEPVDPAPAPAPEPTSGHKPKQPKPTPTSGEAASGPISQADIKSKYGFDPIYSAGINGSGIHIAIATFDGFHMDDVNGFYVQSKISPAPKVDQVMFNGTPAVNENSAVETELDSEFSGMIAPGAQIHVFASAENSDAGELAMFTAILDDGRAKVVNYSWGACEKNVDSAHKADMDKVYARAVAQGVNIMIATGDSGADGCNNGTTSTGWPASEPNAVAVGGTTYGVDSAGNLAETAWSGTGQAGGSGGGVSSFYALPSYQQHFQSPYTKRSIPDVSFDANNSPGQQLWTSCVPDQTTGGCAHGKANWMTIGGTSMAAPQWSGFMALVGEARAKAGKPTLGFLNPIIYGLSSSDYANTFHDITSGNNGKYKAGKGWDAVTGLGSMNADALLNYLTAQ
jgi:subtilase family serine protease